jgi:FixJ family two-component response regulator
MSGTRDLIAIVDDEESVRRALQRLMRAAGFRAGCFASGDAFLASLHAERPDCLILDVHMPGMNGFDVQRALAQLGWPLPVVVITGHDTPDSRDRALAGGAAAYLCKPVDGPLLLGAVSRALGRPIGRVAEDEN